MEVEISGKILEKSSSNNFYENPSKGRREISCRHTIMAKLIFAFRYSASPVKKKINAPSLCRHTNHL